MIAVIALALQVGAARYAAMPGVDSLPRDPVVDSLRRAETKFLVAWRREWLVGRREGPTYQRLASVHCHYDGSWQSGAPNIIRSDESSRSFCPIWFALDDSLPSDESRGVDTSLGMEARQRMRQARAEIIERFAAAARMRPDNPWLMGQLVRLSIDQDDGARALAAARACRASRPWCLLLEGYAHQSAGRVALADTVFMRALDAMTAADRCAWTSVAPLLDDRARGAYEKLDCSARDSVDAKFWWLADPLYIEPGNARRAAHFARKVLVRLHAALTMDERWDWRRKYGGDALALMIVRYGWPAHLYWAGYHEDGGHFDWLGFRDSAVNVAPEYSLPRFQTTPSWSAVLDPGTLSADDWSRFAPRQGYGAVEWENDRWPVEHWARDAGPIVELPEQTVVFRRDSDALVAIGLDLPQRYFGASPVQYEAAIIATRDPTDRPVPSRESIQVDARRTTILTSSLPARPQLVSAELVPAAGAPGLAARARRAIHPQAPLSTLADGQLAISDLLLFEPSAAATDAPPTSATSAIDLMLGSLTLTQSRVGIFWETYGVAPADTVEVTIHIASKGKPGFLKRLGASIGIGNADGGEMSVSWREPRIGQREGLTWAGDVPIQARSVVFDISRLRNGRYTVEITIARAGVPAVSARREITIARQGS
jgi:hypothetical protein